MEQGLKKSSGEGKTFLQVAYGKLRQKTTENGQRVTKDTPGAVLRKTQSGEESWAIEYDSITGTIENMYFKQDAQYGDSYEVTVRVVADLFQISFKDESGFWRSFMERLPNVNIKDVVKIGVYDFESGERRNVGTYLEQENNDKAEERQSKNGTVRHVLPSAYVKKDKDGNIKFMHGYPPSTGVEFKNKNERKKYFIDLYAFLAGEFNRFVAKADFNAPHEKTAGSGTGEGVPEYTAEYVPPVDDEMDGLPF